MSVTMLRYERASVRRAVNDLRGLKMPLDSTNHWGFQKAIKNCKSPQEPDFRKLLTIEVIEAAKGGLCVY